MILNDILLRYISASAIISFFILLLCILSFFINQRYTARIKCYLWLMMTIYLMVPITVPALEEVVEIPVSDTVVEYTGRAAAERDTIFLIWIAGFLISIGYGLLKYHLYRKNIWRWSKCPKKAQTVAIADVVSRKIGIRRMIPVLISEKTASPVLIGFVHPCIYLPHEDYEKEQLIFIIRHELTHYKRRDIWYKGLFLVARAIHWFNPIVYIMCRYASVDIERACDDSLLTGKTYGYRKAYAETILAAIQHQNGNLLATNFCGGMSALKERFRNILEVKRRKRGLMICILCCICILGTNCFVSSGMNWETNAKENQETIQNEAITQIVESPNEEQIAIPVQNDQNHETNEKTKEAGGTTISRENSDLLESAPEEVTENTNVKIRTNPITGKIYYGPIK